MLEYYNREDLGGIIEIDSSLLTSKGMASSTADIAGVIAGVMNALDKDINLEVIKNIILSIEPSDCTFLPGINIFDHKYGYKQKHLGNPPFINILMFSESGEVNTMKFNCKKNLIKKKQLKESSVKKAVRYIEEGIKAGDKKLLGKGATISSIAHQKIAYKSYLSNILNLIEEVPGVYGINIAHSGTLIGILVEPDLSWDSLIDRIKKFNPKLKYLSKNTLIPGGIEIIK
jgi:L-threonine kinase